MSVRPCSRTVRPASAVLAAFVGLLGVVLFLNGGTSNLPPLSARTKTAASNITLIDIADDMSDPFNLADHEPSIAVNPKNHSEIAILAFSDAWSATDPKIMATVWKSRNRGKTWAKVRQLPRPVQNRGGPADQKIAFDADGSLVVAAMDFGPPPCCHIYRQMGKPDDPLTPGHAYGDDMPQLDLQLTGAGPGNNHLYSCFTRFGKGRARVCVMVSDNAGKTGKTEDVGDNSQFPNRTPRLAVGPKGEVYLLYKTQEGAAGPEFEKAHFLIHRSDDCGKTWKALGQAPVSVHGKQTVTTFLTFKFGNPNKGMTATARSSDASIAVDPGKGDIYVAYVDKDRSGFAQLYVARSTDKGETWKPQRVTDGKNHSAYPALAVAKNGTLGLLFIDYDESGRRTVFRHRFARSFDGGQNWSDQVLQELNPDQLTNATDEVLWGDYEGLTAAGNTFYGVFAGESIKRRVTQLDPIFFTETADPPKGKPGD